MAVAVELTEACTTHGSWDGPLQESRLGLTAVSRVERRPENDGAAKKFHVEEVAAALAEMMSLKHCVVV